MKFTLLFAVLICSFSSLLSQSVILFENDSISQLNTNVDISSDFKDFYLDLFFKNNTNEDIELYWLREKSENCPLEWEVFTGDQNNTFLPDVDQSPIGLPMTAADSNFIIRNIFYPRSKAGCCDLKMIFYIDEAFTVAVDTGYYHIEVNAPGCVVVKTIQEKTSEVYIYPNPAADFLHLTHASPIKSVEIFDIYGRKVSNDPIIKGSRINTSILAKGIYSLRLEFNDGMVISKQFIKQ